MRYIILLIILSIFIGGCSQSSIGVLTANTDRDNTLVTIDKPHAEIHAGNHYMYSNQTILASGITRSYYIYSKNISYSHLILSVRASGEANYLLYENPVVSNNGTITNYFNRNRNYPDTNSLQIFRTPTIVSNGKLIYQQHFGSGSRIGGETRSANEIILNPNSEYLWIITSESVGNDISYLIDWYS